MGRLERFADTVITVFSIEGMIILACACFGLLFAGIAIYNSKGRLNNWQDVTGTVTNVDLNHFDKYKNYYNITYRYPVIASSSATPSPLVDPSTLLTFTPIENTQYLSAIDINRAYPFTKVPPQVNSTATIWYDKSNPSIVKFLKPQSRKEKATSGGVTIGIGTVLCFIWCILFVSFLCGDKGVADFFALFAIFSRFSSPYYY